MTTPTFSKEYLNLLLVEFPDYQSYLPTGKHYIEDMSMRARIEIVANRAQVLLNAAHVAGCHHTGALARPLVTDILAFLLRLTREGCNRNDKKEWKNAAKAAGVWSGCPDWSAGKSDAIKDKRKWIDFREALAVWLKEQHKIRNAEVVKNDARDQAKNISSLVQANQEHVRDRIDVV